MVKNGKKVPSYSAAEKRSYYIGYGIGMYGHDVNDDKVRNILLAQSTSACQVSMISGVLDANLHRKRKFKKK